MRTFLSIPELDGQLKSLKVEPTRSPTSAPDRLNWMAHLRTPDGPINFYLDHSFARYSPSGYTLSDAIQVALLQAPALAKSDFPRVDGLDISIAINNDGGLHVRVGHGDVNLQPDEIAKLLRDAAAR